MKKRMEQALRFAAVTMVTAGLALSGCASRSEAAEAKGPAAEIEAKQTAKATEEAAKSAGETSEAETAEAAEKTAASETAGKAEQTTAADTAAEGGKSARKEGEIGLDPSWKYAANSKINSGKAVLYKASANRKGKVICVNAGHGTSGGEKVKTLSHPDGSAKLVTGTNAAGAVSSKAISAGTTFQDGTSEAKVTLATAKILKKKLLAEGYDVLMIRESDDVQLDNIARTVLANNAADCHIALHWDSTASDKGAFYMGVPEGNYRKMEPVASHWQEHEKLGKALIEGLREKGVKIWSNEKIDNDLTQTSYSTVPSMDIELGDTASDHSEKSLEKIADGLVAGVNKFYGK
ncbi:N-acetylmuramoyl-L-alanine amidase family protein [[Clostridium] aminophilum]|uniref:N-acetylmuramoyl-L-alanine amidase n=1 Tax=[Clostridium] aminophilum TaxID=1526 RepID=A0A1I6JEC4_9FIRM|nr:N-acetylmuramoyl-L-alanine amidase [[Clostridium] aminophilum]SFR77311.1 N-acetylmuramoyl-L-alanine amidase [[Clostridium] aminophilum]